MKKNIYFGLFLLLSLFVLVGCGGPKPSKVVERFFKAVEDGEITDAIGYLSTSAVESIGAEKWRSILTDTTLQINSDEGIDKIDILSDETTGEIAKVAVEVTYGNGTTDSEVFDLIKEDGDWKIHVDPFSK